MLQRHSNGCGEARQCLACCKARACTAAGAACGGGNSRRPRQQRMPRLVSHLLAGGRLWVGDVRFLIAG